MIVFKLTVCVHDVLFIISGRIDIASALPPRYFADLHAIVKLVRTLYRILT